MKPKLPLCLALVLTGVMADASDFTVSIVGQGQSNQWQYQKAGLPLVYCPPTTSEPAHLDIAPGARPLGRFNLHQPKHVSRTINLREPEASNRCPLSHRMGEGQGEGPARQSLFM
jgi:hypothetical protein